MRHRSIDSIIHYAEMTKQRGLNVLRFISPSAFAYGSADGRTIKLTSLETLLKRISNIYSKDQIYLGSFPSEVRPEHVTSDALELVKRYCANTTLAIGAQSGSDSLLQAIHRGHGVEEILRATELTVAAGLVPNVDFLFGLPGETPEDCEATLALMKRLVAKGARIHGHAFMPLVGTPLADSPPGVVDQPTRQWLTQLRGRQLERGYWKRQEQLAQEIATFLAGKGKR
jgi:B12-binding domain/radical SAM domain protein